MTLILQFQNHRENKFERIFWGLQSLQKKIYQTGMGKSHVLELTKFCSGQLGKKNPLGPKAQQIQTSLTLTKPGKKKNSEMLLLQKFIYKQGSY